VVAKPDLEAGTRENDVDAGLDSFPVDSFRILALFALQPFVEICVYDAPYPLVAQPNLIKCCSNDVLEREPASVNYR
jgi:hypothetical protein